MGKTLFLDIDYNEIAEPGQLVFLVWAIQLRWNAGTTVRSLRALEEEYTKQFCSTSDSLKERALEALKNDEQQRFERLSVEYLAKKFHIYDYFKHPTNEFKERWVGKLYAYEYFGEMLPTEEGPKKPRGAPRLPKDVNIRRKDFVATVYGEFMSWAYQLFIKTKDKVEFPLRVNITASDYQPIVITFKNLEQTDSTYKILKNIKMIQIFRGLQNLLSQWHPTLEEKDLPDIWRHLNRELKLIENGKKVEETTISKSITLGKNNSKEESPNKTPSIDIRLAWFHDAIFLSNKSLI